MDAVRESHRTETGAVLRSLPFAAFGLSFWWAWVWLAFFSPVLFGQGELANKAYLISVIVVAVSCVGSAALSRMTAVVRSNRFILAAAVLFSLGTFLLIAWVDIPTSWVFIIGSVLTGIGTGPLIVSWGRYYATLKPSASAICILVSFLIAAVLYFAVKGLPPHLGTALVAVLPILSAACIIWLFRDARSAANAKEADDEGNVPEQVSAEQPVEPAAVPAPNSKTPPIWQVDFLPWRLMVGIAIFAFSAGFIVSPSFLSEAVSNELSGTMQVLANALAAVFALAIVAFSSLRLELRSFCRIALPVIAVGFLLISVLSKGHETVGLTIAFFGTGIFELAVWATLARECHLRSADPVMAFGIGHGGKFVGWAAGSLIATVTAPLLTQSQAGLLIVVLLVIGVTFFLQEKAFVQNTASTTENADEVKAAEAKLEDRLDSLASEYGLTPRETEVCELLAKGRTIPYIEEQLSISHSTAVTHTRHIYEKLGIHDRQELIDLVE